MPLSADVMDAWKHMSHIICDQCDASNKNIKLLVRITKTADWKTKWTGKDKKNSGWHWELQSEAEETH